MKQYLVSPAAVLRARIARFARDLRGSLSMETVLVFPLLMWAYIAMFIYFDAFRVQSTNLKAAYAVSDLLSREAVVNQDYIDGMNDVFDYLIASSDPTWLRVTVVKWDENDDEYKVEWSHTTKGKPVHTDATINSPDVVSKIPVLPVGDKVIVVETHMTYEPIFNVGLGQLSLDNFIVTRPRKGPQLQWSDI